MPPTASEIIYDESALAGAVDLVHSQLEILKYLGIPKKNTEPKRSFSGEGESVEIVLLPDLVLDVRKDYLLNAISGESSGNNAHIGAIGGRAARVACILAHLVNEIDGVCKIHFITKTGPLGRLVLDDALRIYNDTNHEPSFLIPSRALNTECIILRNGQPRWALREKVQTEVDSTIPLPHEELSADDIKYGRPSYLINKARTVYLASIKNPDAPAITREILVNLNTPHSILYIDGSRSIIFNNPSSGICSTNINTQASAGNLSRLAKILDICNSNDKIGALFLTQEDIEEIKLLFNNPSDLSDDTINIINNNLIALFQDHHKKGSCISINFPSPIILLNMHNSKVTVWPSPKSNESFENNVTLNVDDAPERFKAGFMLASSVYRTVLATHEQVCDDSLSAYYDTSSLSNIRHFLLHLKEQWGNENNWIKYAINYGIALAKTKNDQLFLRLSDLVDNVKGRALRHSGQGDLFSGADIKIQYRYGMGSCVKIEHSLVTACARLAAQRRAKMLEYKELSFCKEGELKCSVRCHQREAIHTNKLSAAVLFDLDGTLIASDEQRALGLVAALVKIEKEIGYTPEDTVDSVKIFENSIYKKYKVLKRMGLGDFRQQWNHEGWYATYIVFRKNLYDLKIWNKMTVDDKDLPDDQKRLFIKKYNDILNEFRKCISLAQRTFEDVTLHPLKEAFDLLESLKQVKSIGLYILSEGDPETQWGKIERSGLSKYFSRENVLTTGDASFPEKHDKEFGEKKAILEKNIQRIDEQRKLLLAGLTAVQKYRLDHDIHGKDVTYCSYEEQIHSSYNALSIEIRLLDSQLKSARFAERIINRLNEKVQNSVYAAAIRSILVAPNNPLAKLKNFKELSRVETTEESKMKFVMIGDRIDNDIKPVLDLLSHEKIVTIRLNSGKYANKSGIPGIHPMYECNTLAEVKALLLSRELWNKVRCVEGIALFGWTIDVINYEFFPDINDERLKIGLDHLVHGICLGPKYGLIYDICLGVLWEQLLLRVEDEAQVLFSYFFPPYDEELRGQYSKSQRRRVASALLDLGINKHERYKGYFKKKEESYWDTDDSINEY